MANAYVVSGAVISSDNGTQVIYHPKCDSCGNVQDNVTSNGYVGPGTHANLGSFHCPKCGKTFSVQINRD